MFPDQEPCFTLAVFNIKNKSMRMLRLLMSSWKMMIPASKASKASKAAQRSTNSIECILAWLFMFYINIKIDTKNQDKVQNLKTMKQQRYKTIILQYFTAVGYCLELENNDKASTFAQLNNQGCRFFLKSACKKSFQFSLDRKSRLVLD